MVAAIALLSLLGLMLSAFDFGGDDNDDPAGPGDEPEQEPTVEGDAFRVQPGDSFIGTAGDDTISVSSSAAYNGEEFDSTADGGAGDDFFRIGSEFTNDGNDIAQTELTGGAGADIYNVGGLDSDGGPLQSVHVITDFDPNEDVIQISMPSLFNDEALQELTVQPADDGSYTDLVFSFAQDFFAADFVGHTNQTNSQITLRLMGQSDFDAETLEFALLSGVDGTLLSVPSATALVTEIGTNEDDTLVGAGENGALYGGQGNDVATNAGYATLGDGNDTYTATGVEHSIHLGSGDDVYIGSDTQTAQSPPSQPSSDFINAGGGDDTIDAGMFIGAVLGGSGDDVLSADPDAYLEYGTDNTVAAATLVGGFGNDILDLSIGQSAWLGIGQANTDTVNLTVDETHLSRQPAMIYEFGPTDSLVLNIPQDLVADLTVETVFADDIQDGTHAEHIYRIGSVEIARVACNTGTGSPQVEEFIGPAATLDAPYITVNGI